jgi:hypothetical protein
VTKRRTDPFLVLFWATLIVSCLAFWAFVILLAVKAA